MSVPFGTRDKVAQPGHGAHHASRFIGVACAWQVAFLLIASDVRRYRLMMIPAVLEKVTFGVAAVLLYTNGRVAGSLVAGGIT